MAESGGGSGILGTDSESLAEGSTTETATPKGALAKYDEALKYAPNWKQLKEAREALSKHKT